VPHPSELDGFFADADAAFLAGRELAFATVDKASGLVAGSTRFRNMEAAHKRVEIGFTFLGKSWQRTHINTEAKFLMLRHAFETLQLNRVELLTDVLNTDSRNAIARIGAQEEGILRRHMVMRAGRVRDSAISSITREDWPAVKAALETKLAHGQAVWTHEDSIVINASPVHLWHLLADVAGWKRWNAGIEHIELHGPFATGTTFTMRPPGMEPFTSRLVEVRENELFTDATVIDGATVLVHHSIELLPAAGCRVTYRTEVTGAAAAELGPMVTGDFPEVLQALKRLAE
jgi:RimJ/RimL family protein N-acetyltransferase/uncharacterized protein YndB with AHSA1/START domain